MSDPGKQERATYFEPKTFIQPDRGMVATDHVQERRLPPVLDLASQQAHEPTRKSPPTPLVVDADGTYLNVSVEAHPFAGHGNETPLLADPNVVAHLVRSCAERTRLGFLDQFEHIVRIDMTQRNHIPIVQASG